MVETFREAPALTNWIKHSSFKQAERQKQDMSVHQHNLKSTVVTSGISVTIFSSSNNNLISSQRYEKISKHLHQECIILKLLIKTFTHMIKLLMIGRLQKMSKYCELFLVKDSFIVCTNLSTLNVLKAHSSPLAQSLKTEQKKLWGKKRSQHS